MSNELARSYLGFFHLHCDMLDGFANSHINSRVFQALLNSNIRNASSTEQNDLDDDTDRV